MMIDDISSLSICLSVQSFNERRTTWTKHNAQRTAIITMKSSMSSRPVALPSLPPWSYLALVRPVLNS